jgi:hypothetical protein
VKQVIILIISTLALPAIAATGDTNVAALPTATSEWSDLASFLLAALGIAGLLVIRRQSRLL